MRRMRELCEDLCLVDCSLVRMRRMRELCEDLCLVDCSLVRSLSLLPTTPDAKLSTNPPPPPRPTSIHPNPKCSLGLAVTLDFQN